MSPDEERMQILRMLEAGTIKADEAAELLAALDAGGARGEADEPAGKARWMRIRVTDLATGRPKVNVKLPMGLVNVGLKMGARFAPEMMDAQLPKMIEAAQEGNKGKIVDVEDVAKGERVEIYVE